MTNKLTLAALGALFLGLSASAAQANLVSDGDFSNPSGGSLTTYYLGQSFGPWTVITTPNDDPYLDHITPSVDLVGSYWQSATPGGGSVDLDGFHPGGITQHLNIGAGSYVLTFSLSGNSDVTPYFPYYLNVQVGNANTQYLYQMGAAGTYSHTNMNYISETLAFTTTGATDLTFTSLEDPSNPYGPVISGVDVESVSNVPLPGSVLMFMTGLAALLGVHYFRKNRVTV